MRLVAPTTFSFEGGRVNWRPLHTGKARPSAGAINPALLVNMRRPTALFIIGGCAVALVPRATPARPRTRLQASLDSFLADRSAAKLFYDGVSDGALKSYAGDALPDNSLDDQKKISALVDYMHTELMKKSMMADYTDEAAPLGDEFDDFIEEGRKMLAISHSRVCEGADEVAVSETVWPALAELFKDEKEDSGILCLLPDFNSDPATFLDQEVVEPLSQMGFGDRLETCVYAKKDGAPHNSFRIIVSPSAVPADAPNKSDDKDTMSAADKADEEAGRSGEGKVI